MKTLATIEAEKIQEALVVNQFSITDTAKALSIGRSTLYRKITEYGLKMRVGDLPEFKEDLKEDLRKAVQLTEDLIEMCDQCADFSNGNTHGGFDEGRVLASNSIYRIQEKIKELKNRNNL